MGNKKSEIVCAGEILADLIGQTYTGNGKGAPAFEAFAGGSPANLAANLARLGHKVGLLAAVGNDNLGKMLMDKMTMAGVQNKFIAVREIPSTVILVSRSKSTAEFEAYRSADFQLTMGQVDIRKLSKAKIFHTTCFGLSKEPARSTIMACAEAVIEQGGQLSIDLNYAKKIWPKRKKAFRLISEYLSHGALVKCSDVDYQRIFDQKLKQPQKALDQLLGMGAKQVCLTLGEAGCWVADPQNESYLPSRKVKVVDTTGAGDAFWSGYLSAYLHGENMINCAKAGRGMAELKLNRIGPIEESVSLSKIMN